MRISNGSRIGDLQEINGYGYATGNMLRSLARLGYEVNPNDATADVEIWFDQPQHWKFSEGVYKIGYHPWESTKLLPVGKMSGYTDWLEIMNQCDEIWTPSPLIADWYRRFAGIRVPVYVYEHGVDPVWAPVRRSADRPFTFLHQGGEANRKGLKETLAAYRMAFGVRRGVDVLLTLKMINEGWNINHIPGIESLNGVMELDELVELFQKRNVFVYPSYGEGFGLSPLQALATGMPTITVPGWAPYAKFIHPDLAIPSMLKPSPWPQLHPGLMLRPDQDAVTRAMLFARAHYDELVDWHLEQVPRILEEYSWDRITETVFTDLEKRI